MERHSFAMELKEEKRTTTAESWAKYGRSLPHFWIRRRYITSVSGTVIP